MEWNKAHVLVSSKQLNCGVHHVSPNIEKPLAFKNVTDLKDVTLL